MKTVIIVAAVLLLLVLAAAWFLAGSTVTGKRQTLDEAWEWQKAHFDASFYPELEKTEYTVTGEGGYILHAELLKNPQPSDRYMILSHGYTDNRIGSLKYAGMYLDLGYNCIIYDLRGHGMNDNTFTSYGILEAKDLIRLIEDTRNRYPELKQLGLHGESLGAATVITSLKYRPEVDFAIADCGFSDIENVLRGVYKSFGVPAFFFELADLGTRIRYHYSLKSMRPIDALEGNRVPILFIHGEADSFILPKNARDMYENAAEPKALCLISGAEHARSILTDPAAYREAVTDFLRKIGCLSDHLPGASGKK